VLSCCHSFHINSRRLFLPTQERCYKCSDSEMLEVFAYEVRKNGKGSGGLRRLGKIEGEQ
jgi:hypothetical protein